MDPMQPHDPALEKLRESYLSGMLERLEARSKHLAVLQRGFVGFGALFLLLVALPFVGLHRERAAANAELAEVRSGAEEVAVALEAYGAAAEGFVELRDVIGRAAYELRDALRTLPLLAASQGAANSAPPPFVQAAPIQSALDPVGQQAPLEPSPASACAWLNDPAAETDCVVGRIITGQFDRYAEILEASVIRPVQELPSGIASRPDSAALRAGLDSLRLAFENRLASEPQFWLTLGGKVDFFAEVARDLDHFWTRFGFEQELAALRETEGELRADAAELERSIEALGERETALDARLAAIESPLGRLPIGLVEGLQLYPLLMAIGFGWCFGVLAEVVALRRALQSEYGRGSAELARWSDRYVSLLAPLPAAEAETRSQGLVGRALFFAPVALFGIGCLLVVYYWTAWADTTRGLVLDPWLYGALYVLAATGLVVGSRRALDLLGEARTSPSP